MRLSRLEIHGFKSFCNRTVLDLPDGLNAIVGPNGCGKSNVVDAIRWVLGEQSARSLRGRSMEDVIFSGTQNRPPSGLAEVTLVFEQDDRSPPPVAYMQYPEIRVSRILHRDGTSEYRLMNMPCRLKDIVDVFSGTGLGSRSYAIIEQGKIAHLIAARPDERRLLFEEAAQISRYRARRRDSEKRLEESRHHLERIGDVVRELGHQTSRLERQKVVAQRVQELERRRFVLERWRAVAQARELLSRMEKARKSAADLEEKLQGVRTELQITQTGSESLRLRKTAADTAYRDTVDTLIHLEKKLAGLAGTEKIGTNQIAQLEKFVENARQKKVENRRKMESTEELVHASREKQAHLLSVVTVKSDELARLEQEFRTARNRKLDLEAKVQELRNEVLQLEKQLSHQSAMVESEARKQQENELQKKTFTAEIADMRKKLAALEPELESCRNRKAVIEKQYRELEAELKQVELAISEQTDGIGELQKRRVELEKLDGQLSGKLRYLQEIIEGHEDADESARKLGDALEQEGLRDLVDGFLLEAFAPGAGEVPAVERILDGRTHAFRVSDADRIPELLELAARHAGGFATFVLPVKTPDSHTKADVPGEWTPLSGLVKCPDQRFSRWLSGWWMAPDLASALVGLDRIPADGGCVVGENLVVTGRGEILACGPAARSAFRIRLERDELVPRVAQLQKDREALDADLDLRDENLRNLTERIKALRGQLVQTQAQLQEQLILENRLHSNHSTLEQVMEDRQAAFLRLETAAQSPVHKGDPELEKKARNRQEKLRILLEESAGVSEHVDALQEQLQTERIASESWKQKIESERRLQERLEEELELVHVQLEDADAAIEQSLQRMKEIRDEIEVARAQCEQDNTLLESARSRHDALRKETEQLGILLDAENEKIRKLERQANPLQSRLNENMNEISRLEGNYAYIQQDFSENFPMQALDVLMEEEEFNRPFSDAEKAERESVLAELEGLRGDYNPHAIADFEEVSGRYQTLSAQLEDLQKAVTDLEKAIVTITELSRERFLDSFEGISERFRTLFPRLFGGGSANLKLTDGDPLEAGVEILVQLPGKRTQAMELLSGGEKAMTAIALLFSLFLFRPSPLCVLDEVDAPLDETNVVKYNALLREMSRTTQFLVITHNRRTMEAMDRLVGVTMDEPGCSSIYTVALDARN